MQSYSFGPTPKETITAAAVAQCPNGYPMTIKSKGEWSAIASAWNQGIDSRLEAITERSSANAATGEVNIHPEELETFLRRLYEAGDDDSWQLRSCILATLDIEEI